MKKFQLFIFILCIIFYSNGISYAQNEIFGKVIGISDGDTITVLENTTQYKIRLYGIDAPVR